MTSAYLKQWAQKLVVVIPGHSKCGFDISRKLVEHSVPVLALSSKLKQLEAVRTQMPIWQRPLFQPIECDLNCLGSIKWALLIMRENLLYKPSLFIIMVPEFQENDSIYERGNEYLLQLILDSHQHNAQKFVVEAKRLLFDKIIATEELDTCAFWIIKFNVDDRDKVVKEVLERMSKFTLK